jgi:hypothetical protein
MKIKLAVAVAACPLLAANFAHAAVPDTCTGTYPSYWQDLAPKFAEMWKGQAISDAPTGAYSGPVFKLSDDYPRKPVDDAASQPWRAARFDALFDPATPQNVKARLAQGYGNLVYEYAIAGNIDQPGSSDFDVWRHPVRPWYHIPFQTYDALSGREFIHGLTREAPVTYSIKSGTGTASTTMWAVGIFNAIAAYTLGTVWQKEGTAKVPSANIRFDEGAVVAKPLFNTATVDKLPVLANIPHWNANISDPSFCACVAGDGKQCTLVEQSQQCPRNFAKWNDVKLMQFDISVRDHRARHRLGLRHSGGRRTAQGQRQGSMASLEPARPDLARLLAPALDFARTMDGMAGRFGRRDAAAQAQVRQGLTPRREGRRAEETAGRVTEF